MNEWIYLSEDEPEYYRSINIVLKDDSILYDWHILTDMQYKYFGSTSTDKILLFDEVVQWQYA